MAASTKARLVESRSGLGARVAEARRERGLTQKQLADRLGVALWTVEKLEQTSQFASLPLLRIAEATGKPAAWFEVADPSRASAVQANVRADGPLSSADRTARNAVLATIVLVLVVRFFTEVVGVLPPAGNFIDVLLLILLASMVAVRPHKNHVSVSMRGRWLAAGVLFFGVATVSLVLNLERIDPGPSLTFFYGFLAPLAFFGCAHRLWPAGQAQTLSRTLVVLGLLELVVVAIFDLPRFLADGNPDHISGTFGENPNQLVFFLLLFVSVLAAAATFERGSHVARFAPVLIGATFVVIFLAQYRALLLATALSAVVIGLMLARARGRGALIGAFAIGALVVGFSYVAERYPTTKFAPTLAAIREKPDVFARARLEPFQTVLELYDERPSVIVTGTGPGTYSSRAWRTFAEVGKGGSVEGATAPYAGYLTGGEAYRTDVSDRYVRPVLLRRETLLGSAVAEAPFSSYTSLLAEVGVPGFLILLTIYLAGLATAVRLTFASFKQTVGRNSLPAVGLACTIAFLLLLQMAFLDNWLEVTRVTIPAWVLLAVVMKESKARNQASS